jgi:hypothetical protein
MYSRAERTAKDTKTANPNLGPGSYQKDDMRKSGPSYAPFSSLSPRVSFFESNVKSGPAPCSYDGPNDFKVNKSALFGHSQTVRFCIQKCVAPGPGTYGPSESALLQQKTRKGQKAVFNQVPVGVCEDEKSNQQIDTEPIKNTENTGQKLNGTRMSLINRTGIVIPQKHNNDQQIISSIVWKRKYLPPSIPMGRYAYGYQENKDGGNSNIKIRYGTSKASIEAIGSN